MLYSGHYTSRCRCGRHIDRHPRRAHPRSVSGFSSCWTPAFSHRGRSGDSKSNGSRRHYFFPVDPVLDLHRGNWRTYGGSEVVSALCVERQGLGQGDDRACPDRDISSLVLSISDCKLADDVKFPDLIPSLKAWAEYREGHGSTAGMRVLLPRRPWFNGWNAGAIAGIRWWRRRF